MCVWLCIQAFVDEEIFFIESYLIFMMWGREIHFDATHVYTTQKSFVNYTADNLKTIIISHVW